MKSNTFKTVTLVFGTALFISTNSFAQRGNREDRKKPPKFSELLKEMDAKEDGFISEEELKKTPKPKRVGKRQYGKKIRSCNYRSPLAKYVR